MCAGSASPYRYEGLISYARADEPVAAWLHRALENDEAFLEESNANLAYPLTCIGEALLGQDRPQDAMKPQGRAFDLRNKPDISKAALAWTQWLYGRALTESGKDADVGIEYVNSARDVFAGMGEATKSELRDVESWLARWR